MKNRFRALAQLDNVIPSILVILAVVISLEPKPFGIEISDRQIFLALFAVLGADAIVERSGRLYTLEKKLDDLAQQLVGPVSADKVLRTRAAFERMDVLLSRASRNITIIGINLEGAITGLSQILALASAGGTVKLLAMDPDGACIVPSASMSGVDPEIRRQKIRQNLDLIKGQITAQLSSRARHRITLSVADSLFPAGIVAIDTDRSTGWLIAQHYLVGAPAEHSPIVRLSRELDPEWFQRYLDQCKTCFEKAREW